MSNAPAHIHILMATYNGAAYLRAQLHSIAMQDHDNWTLWISDDGSTDDTLAIIDDFRRELRQKIHKMKGPSKGNAAANFLHLLQKAEIQPGDYLAFSDQDDVWLPDRLSRALARIESYEDPALYCARTWIDEHQSRRLSPPRPKPLGLRNALVQNVASGNTILLNPKASGLIKESAKRVNELSVHDWWCYIMVSAAGGVLVHDDTPTLIYRQHGANEIGANDSWAARWTRLHRLLKGDLRVWTDINLVALNNNRDLVSDDAWNLIARFEKCRDLPLRHRLRAFAELGLYRQSQLATCALWLALILKKL